MTKRTPRVLAAVTVAGGLLVGAAAGAGLYLLVQLSGLLAATLTGAVVSAASVVATRSLKSSLAVKQVDVHIPQLTKITFESTRDRRGLAHRIVNQMTSRITVQRLGDNTGYARDALSSIYAFNTWLRNALDADPGTRPRGKPNVDVLALNLLNVQLRPFLERWHRSLGDWEKAHPGTAEHEWPQDAEFRAELVDLQNRLRPIAIAFAELAGYADYRDIIGLGDDPIPPPRRIYRLSWRPSLLPAW